MSDIAAPKVSVVISTFDRPQMLDRALASVHAQTFADFEVIVVDDGSPEPLAYEPVLNKWQAALDARGINLFALRIDVNSGYQCFPKNRGIEHASGDYIAYLDDDNVWLPQHLATVTAAIEADFSHDMVYSRVRYVVDNDATRALMQEKQITGFEGDTVGTAWNPQLMGQRNYIDTSTVLHSKGAFWRLVRESGYGWDESLRRFGDWNLFWRWGLAGLNGKLVDEVTVEYHWHAGCLQLTRPLIETPMTFNYAQWLASRKATDEAIGYTRPVPAR